MCSAWSCCPHVLSLHLQVLEPRGDPGFLLGHGGQRVEEVVLALLSLKRGAGSLLVDEELVPASLPFLPRVPFIGSLGAHFVHVPIAEVLHDFPVGQRVLHRVEVTHGVDAGEGLNLTHGELRARRYHVLTQHLDPRRLGILPHALQVLLELVDAVHRVRLGREGPVQPRQPILLGDCHLNLNLGALHVAKLAHVPLVRRDGIRGVRGFKLARGVEPVHLLGPSALKLAQHLLFFRVVVRHHPLLMPILLLGEVRDVRLLHHQVGPILVDT